MLTVGRSWSVGSEYRFGFNGMEKDDEIMGGDNCYTTSERLYDPRIGRWIKPDLLEAEATSWTPYRYAFDNPLRFSDPDGNFEIDETTAAQYPKLNAYLQNLAIEYAGKPEAFRKAFKEYGQLSDAQVDKILEYKLVKNGTPISSNQDNPRIAVEAMTSANGMTAIKVFVNGSGNFKVSNDGVIKLNKSLVENFEKNHSTNVETEGAKILLELTVFHELTHYGDNLDGTADKTPISAVGGIVTLNGSEGGKDFEKKAYGRDIGNGTTYNDVITDANKYANDNNINDAATKDYFSKDHFNQDLQKNMVVPVDNTRVYIQTPIIDK